MIDSITSQLPTYGALGLWTLSLLFERFSFQREMKTLVNNNTVVVARNSQILEEIKKKI
jgi:hypothetical protein